MDELFRAMVREELHGFGETLRQASVDDLRKVLSSTPPEHKTECELVSVKRAAEICDNSPQTIRKWIKSGELRSHSRTRHKKIDVAELKALLGQPRGQRGEVVDLDAKARSLLARAHSRRH